MSQLSNNNQVNETSTEKPQLCRKCCEFFANKATEYLCSKCFKESNPTKNTTTVAQNIVSEIVPVHKHEEEKCSHTPVVASSTETTEKVQVDPKKCFACPKKVGALGHQCKCGFTFCKSHRLPEDHDCTFNFREEGLKKLTKENPAVVAAKISKI